VPVTDSRRVSLLAVKKTAVFFTASSGSKVEGDEMKGLLEELTNFKFIDSKYPNSGEFADWLTCKDCTFRDFMHFAIG
jgi:hypothetical protein